MNQQENTSWHEQDSTVSNLLKIALDARRRLEQAWGADTAYQGTVLRPDDPPSRGQCGASSLWFSRELCEQGINATFVEGDILLGGDAKEGHCWVEVDRADSETIIVDVTSDQFKTLFSSPIHIGTTADVNDRTHYIKQHSFDPFHVPRKKLSARCDILTNRM